MKPDVLESLRTYRWPGNVRELRNWVEATVAMGEAPDLFRHDSVAPRGGDAAARLDLPYKDARNAVLCNFEHQYLEHLLATTNGNVSEASRRARMDRSYLIKLLQRHGFRDQRASLSPDAEG